MHKSLQLLLTVGICLLVVQTSSAQVTITSTDFFGLIGEHQLVNEETSETGITVDVGSAGANQTWDFTSVVLSGESFSRTFSDPADTPFAAEFPAANFAFAASFSDTANVFQYLFVDTGGISELGDVVQFGDSTFIDFTTPPSVIDLPIAMNSTWSDVERDTVSFPPAQLIITDSSTTTADAWGTITTAIGTIDVLRLRLDDISISNTVLSGVVVSSDTTRTICYEWISPSQFIIASVESLDDETDPNFTQAQFVSLVGAITTGVEEDEIDREISILDAVYPNPTSSSVTVRFNASSDTDLAIFDLLGRRVRVLQTSSAPGLQTVTWDGKSESGKQVAPGVYFIRIQDDDRVEARRLVVTL